ncbi:hypothetical protein DFH08DRAFT_158109 [Mycena albidolilacea]|uniref:Uncharacterized protein n=1 Tax=Mycena albidolilacea TaxID=1033008 RepID=A0AAD7A2H9_9AGAR|nr:hypothetical protein DFH08DRAFT_158109 [Mycena albidolilacea]
MLLKTVLLAIALPMCLASLAIDARAPVSPAESFLDRSVTTNASYLESLSEKQRQVFEYVLDSLDDNFSPPFLFNSPRYSAWYAVGLLARNGKGDVAIASDILKDVISFQFTDPNTNWYGTFKAIPSAPDPSDVYPPRLYTSYDTNIGLFVCTSFIIIIEEFQHLLEPSLVALIKESMYNATVGDGYRVGGVNGDGYSAGGFIGDNLYPIYSNPWYMRIMAATYVGKMVSDTNMSYWGDQWAAEAVANFNLYGTLAEFNSGTYTGVTLYALSLWGYMPRNSTIAKHAKDIIGKTWASIGMYYNPTLHTLGGPWDRAYGYDMRAYYGILGGQIAGLIGGIEDGSAPIPRPIVGSEHFGDAAANVLTPLVAKFHDPYVPAAALAQLKGLSGSHAYSAQAVSPPWDNPAVPRNYTSWTAPGMSLGAIASDEKVVGGAATNQAAYVPASIIWSTGTQTAWFNMYPTSGTIAASASRTGLTIAYPPSTAFASNTTVAAPTSNVMTFLFGGFPHLSLPADFLANGTGTLPGLQLAVSGNVLSAGVRTLVYGASTINDLPYYNLTYSFGDLDSGVPQIEIVVEKI